jgi:hypothetical protein
VGPDDAVVINVVESAQKPFLKVLHEEDGDDRRHCQNLSYDMGLVIELAI